MSAPGKKMGLSQATMLVAGNMIGTGVFLLPVNLASVGGIAVFGWVVATAGAAALGLVFAKLGELEPKEGGPYAYARDFLGPYVGFQTNYIYWFGNWIGNIAIAIAAVGYLAEFFPSISQPPASVFATRGGDLGAHLREHPGSAGGRGARDLDHEPGADPDPCDRVPGLDLVRPRHLSRRLERERRLQRACHLPRGVDGALGLHGDRERGGVRGRDREPQAQHPAGHADRASASPPWSTC